MGVLGGESPMNIKWIALEKSCDKSAGLDYFSNDNSIKKRH